MAAIAILLANLQHPDAVVSPLYSGLASPTFGTFHRPLGAPWAGSCAPADSQVCRTRLVGRDRVQTEPPPACARGGSFPKVAGRVKRQGKHNQAHRHTPIFADTAAKDALKRVLGGVTKQKKCSCASGGAKRRSERRAFFSSWIARLPREPASEGATEDAM